MSYVHPCPHCGQSVSVFRDMVGTAIGCPTCGSTFTVNPPTKTRAKTPAQESEAPPRREPRPWYDQPLMVLLVLTAAIAIGNVVALLLVRLLMEAEKPRRP
jgi:DNA-directed RNA polymerase subunit RPC12/RpoP